MLHTVKFKVFKGRDHEIETWTEHALLERLGAVDVTLVERKRVRHVVVARILHHKHLELQFHRVDPSSPFVVPSFTNPFLIHQLLIAQISFRGHLCAPFH